MSGHSKWSTIKRKKGVEDQKRGQLFTKLARAITLAVREGGGIDDPSSNFKLRLAMDRAKEYNMPKDNMKRAIDRGTGKNGGADDFQRIIYEGYGPGGVAFMIETATDNKQRTAAQVKHVLDIGGGNLGSPGSVSFQFTQKGLLFISKDEISEDELFEKAIEAGADDVQTVEDGYELYTERDSLHTVREALEKSGLKVLEADLVYHPVTTIEVDEKTQSKISQVIDDLEELDDVQKVYVNAL